MMSKTMLDYIREIPEYIRKCLESSGNDVERLADCFCDNTYSSLTIIASGSSFHAAGCAKYYLREKLNMPVYIETPFTFVHYEPVYEDSFYIVISQSGRSINTLNAIEKLHQRKMIAHFLTDSDEIVSTEEMLVYQLNLGNEEVPFVTKGFSAIVFNLIMFARKVCFKKSGEIINSSDIEMVIRLFDGQMDRALTFFEENKQSLLSMKRIHVCGAGPNQFVAREGALKFCETLQMNASGYEIEEFLHGANFELKRDHTVFLISSSEKITARVQQMKTNLPFLCDRVYVLDMIDSLDESLATILYGCFFQTLVYLINRELGNEIPLMKKEYLEFEALMKAKTVNYYE